MMKDNRKVLYGLVALALVLSVVGISIGFASMSQDLTISGTTEVVPASWKIKFANLSSPTLAGDAEVTTAPTIQGDTHIGNYAIKLTMPGDSVTYTFDVVNDGTIDAKLTSLVKAAPTFTASGTNNAATDATTVQSNFVYELTYADGSAIGVNDELDAGDTVGMKLVVGYNTNANALPQDKVSVTGMDITLTYGQN